MNILESINKIIGNARIKDGNSYLNANGSMTKFALRMNGLPSLNRLPNNKGAIMNTALLATKINKNRNVM